MYASQQMLRVHHDEWLRYAETRRQIKRAAALSRTSSPAPRRARLGRPLLRLGRLAGQG